MNLKNYFRCLFYLFVALAAFVANAGSYDDFFNAIRNDNAGAVSSLLQRGFDPNSRDPKGQPGLTVAMQERASKAARVLLDSSAIDVNTLNASGESALMIAALKGDVDSAKLLLEHGARVNQPGWSPLHYAAAGPEPKLVKLLIERGADVDATSPNGTTPLMMAAQYGSEESADLLLQRGADAKRRNQRDLGAADFARLAGREALIRRLQQGQR